MIPQTFEQWKNCMERDCGIQLTKQFAQQRLLVFEDKESAETKKFAELYGWQHLNNIINWLKLVQ